MITSGILGKSKSKTGKEVTENVDTNSKTKLVFKPEFNFLPLIAHFAFVDLRSSRHRSLSQ